MSAKDLDIEAATVDFYSRCAEHYASLPEGIFPQEYAYAFNELAHEIGGRPVVLDVGCGPGRAAENLPSDVRYIGVDVSAPMIKIARSRRPDKDFRTANVLDLRPVVPETCDVVIANFSLCHITRAHMTRALQNIRSVMRTGGLGFFIMPYGDEENVITQADFEDLSQDCQILQVAWTEELLRPHIQASLLEEVRVESVPYDYSVLFTAVRAI